ncbi:MAG: hypothetical protein JJU10_11390 [Idiomarina sp.]|nr:hypothetical protein [Idiomarina sp.]
MKFRKPWLGELGFLLCAVAVANFHAFAPGPILYWNLLPVLVFGGAYVLLKRTNKPLRWAIAIGSWIAMGMLIYSHFGLRWVGADHADFEAMYLFVPMYSLTAGGLATLAIYIVLRIKRIRGEF